MFFQISHPSKIQVTTTKSTKPKPTKIHKPSLKIEECIHHSGSLTSSNHGGQGANSIMDRVEGSGFGEGKVLREYRVLWRMKRCRLVGPLGVDGPK